jgi:hypothetical protein
MQRPTLLEGILVALIAGLVASPMVFVLCLVLGVSLAWKAVLVSMAYAYIVYLLAQSGRTAGRITFALLSLLVLLASLVFEVRWSTVALIAVALIWGIRTYAYGQSLVAALLHGGLCLLGLGAALWAYAYSGSIALAGWSFFLMQAVFVFVPSRLTWRTPAEGYVAAGQEVDGFVLAYQAAQQALGRLRAKTAPGG